MQKYASLGCLRKAQVARQDQHNSSRGRQEGWAQLTLELKALSGKGLSNPKYV